MVRAFFPTIPCSNRNQWQLTTSDGAVGASPLGLENGSGTGIYIGADNAYVYGLAGKMQKFRLQQLCEHKFSGYSDKL